METHDVQDGMKAVLRKLFMALDAYIKIKKRSKSINLRSILNCKRVYSTKIKQKKIMKSKNKNRKQVKANFKKINIILPKLIYSYKQFQSKPQQAVLVETDRLALKFIWK